jgi:hypothetical protein
MGSMMGREISNGELGSAAGWAILIPATVYGVGKTFLWPTMLGVVGERFPKGGALAMGAMGGVGMLSAGLLGGPGFGYVQDVNASSKLEQLNPAAYEQVVSSEKNHFLFFKPVAGLDGAKVEAISPGDPDYAVVKQAETYGGEQALKITAFIPATMAVGYLALLIYFRAIGGYKLVEIGPGGKEHETERHPTAKDAIYTDAQADQA